MDRYRQWLPSVAIGLLLIAYGGYLYVDPAHGGTWTVTLPVVAGIGSLVLGVAGLRYPDAFGEKPKPRFLLALDLVIAVLLAAALVWVFL